MPFKFKCEVLYRALSHPLRSELMPDSNAGLRAPQWHRRFAAPQTTRPSPFPY